MILYDEPTGNTDLPPVRLFPLKNGNTVKASKDDEYGFWYLSLTQGTLPPDFKGAYTSIEEVEKAIKRYSNVRDIPLGTQDPRPVVKFKEVKQQAV